MRKSRMLMFVAVLCAVCVAACISNAVQPPGSTNPIKTDTVPVESANDVHNLGQEDGQLTEHKMPEHGLEVEGVRKSRLLEGRSEDVGCFGMPDRVKKQESDVIYADYLAGMPIILQVRLVNLGVKKARQGHRPIVVSDDWYDGVRFALVDNQGSIHPLTGKLLSEEEPSDVVGEAIEIVDNEVSGRWLIKAEQYLAVGEGEFQIVIEWDGVRARKIMVSVRKPEGVEDNTRVLLRTSLAHHLAQQNAAAIDLLEKVMEDKGRYFDDGGVFALMIYGDALAQENRREEALKAYHDYLEYWHKTKGPRDEEPEILMWKINRLRGTGIIQKAPIKPALSRE